MRKALIALLSVISLAAIAQTRRGGESPFPASGPPAPAQSRRGDPFPAPGPPTQAQIDMEKTREKSHRKEQYESLKKDTDQLLALATELKASVDKTSENTL